jgi:DNA-binding MarR family transcriptional regulator
MHPLTALGISEAAMRTYVDLVEHGEAAPEELAGRIGCDEAELEPVLADLRRLGLVEPREDRVLPVPPHLALEALAQQRAREAALAREVADGLSQLWARGAGQTPIWSCCRRPRRPERCSTGFRWTLGITCGP